MADLAPSRPYLGNLRVLGLDENPRCQELHARWAFYCGTQHDHHKLTWDGEQRAVGTRYMQARMKPYGYVPLENVSPSAKKPDTPLPLVRQVVSRFTEMLLGEGRRPQLLVPQDLATQDYLEAIFQAADLWEVLSQGRDLMGGCGSTAIVAGVLDGDPFSEVLHAGNLWVPEWDQKKKGWVPEVVVEQIQVMKDELDNDTGKLKSEAYWRSRAWTDKEIIIYEDARVRGWPKDRPFIIQSCVGHNMGRCPVFWGQNTLNAKSPDGDPDCEGAWELLDQVDREQSIVHRAIRNNTAPTVVVRDSKAELRRPKEFVKGKVIEVSSDGDAKYLEMAGQSIEIGLKGIDALTMQILRTVECIVLDPEQAKSYNSGESLQMLWRSMECAAGRRRVTLQRLINDLAEFWISLGVKLKVGDNGITLPPRRIKVEDAETDSGGEDSWGTHTCKEGLSIDMKWPPYWTPTAKQINELCLGLAKAVGGKENPSFMSVPSAVQYLARTLGLDPDVEVQKVETQHDEQLAEQQEIAEAANELEKELAKAKPAPKPSAAKK